MSAIRILAICPYPGMAPLLQEVAAGYSNIQLTIEVGDLAQGLARAQEGFHGNFDVIISRGGTAQLLQKAISLPVVEITTSVYDVLCTLQRANPRQGKVAVVGYSNITQDMQMLKELLPYKIGIFAIESTGQVVATLQYLRQNGYTSLLCDMVTYTAAREMDFSAFLITSSAESVRAAFEKAIFFCSANRQLREENHFFRQLLHQRISQTVVFTVEGKLFFSTLEEAGSAFLDVLREKIGEVPGEGQAKFLLQYHGQLYHIQARRIVEGQTPYVSFYFFTTLPPAAGDKYGISYHSQEELEQACGQSIYSVVGLTSQYHRAIGQACAGREPVFLSGETGTGKEYIARILYLRGPMCCQPFVQIDCSLQGRKTWAYLLGHHNSPLCDTDNTLFFQNLEALDEAQWHQLLAFLLEGRVYKNNRLIFSCAQAPHLPHVQQMTQEFINRLSCFPLFLAPLRTQPAQLDMAFDLFLDHHAISTGAQLAGIDSAALELLHQYSWPQNYLQFRRVMGRLTAQAKGAQISPEEVRQALQQELSFAQTSAAGPSAAALDLSRPLSEIDREIVQIVLEKHGDNQTRAAQSLGISRTTLWRMLKD